MTESYSVNTYGDLILLVTNNRVRKMTELQRLKLTKEKWVTVRNGETNEQSIQDGGRTTCPLCIKYWYDQCKECPVDIETQAWRCANTPIGEWEKISAGADYIDAIEIIDEIIALIDKLIEIEETK